MVFIVIEWFYNAVVINVLHYLFIFSVLFLFCLFIFPGEAGFRFFYGVGVVMKSVGKNIK